jgi:hypothetical protein
VNVTVSVCDIVVQIIVIMILLGGGRGCGGVVGTHVTRGNRLRAKL